MKVHEMEGYDEVIRMLVTSLPPQEVLAAFRPEQRLAALPPEKVLAAFKPEERLAGLAPEQAVLALPNEMLRALSDAYLDTLPVAARDAVRARIGT